MWLSARVKPVFFLNLLMLRLTAKCVGHISGPPYVVYSKWLKMVVGAQISSIFTQTSLNRMNKAQKVYKYDCYCHVTIMMPKFVMLNNMRDENG